MRFIKNSNKKKVSWGFLMTGQIDLNITVAAKSLGAAIIARSNLKTPLKRAL